VGRADELVVGRACLAGAQQGAVAISRGGVLDCTERYRGGFPPILVEREVVGEDLAEGVLQGPPQQFE